MERRTVRLDDQDRLDEVRRASATGQPKVPTWLWASRIDGPIFCSSATSASRLSRLRCAAPLA